MSDGAYEVVWWFDNDGPHRGRSAIPDWQAAQDEIIDQIEPPEDAAGDVLDLLATLTVKQRFVVERRYGVFDGYVYSFDELGLVMGISRQAVQKLEQTALRRLKRLTTQALKGKEISNRAKPCPE